MATAATLRQNPADFWDNERQKAADFVEVSSTEELARAVRYGLKNGLLPTLCRYQMGKTESLTQSMLLDTRPLNKIVVDKAAMTVTFQTSSFIQAVDTAAAREGLAVVAGTFSVLRLGGVVLGGGYGWLSGQYGLAADGLLEATVVLADGRVLKASERENQDLFWGLRGSYSNLGICTELTVRAHPIPTDIFWCTLTYPSTSQHALAAVLSAAATIREKTINPRAAFCVRLTIPEGSSKPSLTAMVCHFHCPDHSVARKVFAPLFDLKIDGIAATEAIQMIPYTRMNSMLDDTSDHSDQVFASAGANIPIAAYSAEGLAALGHELQRDAPGLVGRGHNWTLVLGIDYRDAGKVAGGGLEQVQSMAFAARHDGPIVYIRGRWDDDMDPVADKKLRALVKDVGRKLRDDYAMFEKNGMPGAYPGFCSQGDLSAKEMFGPNYDRLLEVKRKYDPNDVFNPGFLLSKQAH